MFFLHSLAIVLHLQTLTRAVASRVTSKDGTVSLTEVKKWRLEVTAAAATKPA